MTTLTYRVGDDKQVGIRAGLSSGLCKVAHNRGIGVEEIITGHARLAGDASRNDDNLSTSQAVLEV